MIGAREFALMQPHAFFITTARGFIHDEEALYEALRDKRIAGAGLDVWDKEPPPPDHPLLQFDNVLASPHTAGVTKEARMNMGRIAAEQILDALDGKRPPRIVNPEVWPAYVRRFERDVWICAEIGRHSRERSTMAEPADRFYEFAGAAAALCRLGQRNRAAADPDPWRARPLPQLGCDRAGHCSRIFMSLRPTCAGTAISNGRKEAATVSPIMSMTSAA